MKVGSVGSPIPYMGLRSDRASDHPYRCEMELCAEWRNCMGNPGEMELLAGCTIFMVGGRAWARGGMAPQGNNTRWDRLPAPGSPCRGGVVGMVPTGRPRIGAPAPVRVSGYPIGGRTAPVRVSGYPIGGRTAPVRLGRQQRGVDGGGLGSGRRPWRFGGRPRRFLQAKKNPALWGGVSWVRRGRGARRPGPWPVGWPPCPVGA